MGVDYNVAIAGMEDQVTLLNIVRAKEQIPLHFTSINRMNGNLTVKGTAGFGDEIKGTEIDTTTGGTNPNIIGKTGVDTLKPTIGGEVNTGSNFDIGVLDSQKFYQGITAAIPFTTIENYLAQGFPDQLLTRLVVARIDFKNGEEGAGKGKLLFSWINAPGGPDAREFAKNMACYRLFGRGTQKKVDIAPVSRISLGPKGKRPPLTLEGLIKLDGKPFELSKPLSNDAREDSGVLIRRVGTEQRLADLQVQSRCPDQAMSEVSADGPKVAMVDPTAPPSVPPADPVYLGNGEALILSVDGKSDRRIKVDAEITFRSPEAVIRYVGGYLAANRSDRYLVDGNPLFVINEGRSETDLVSVKLLGQWFSISRSEKPRNSMVVLGFIEQLIDLHKESADRPVTVPVQVIGG